MGARLLYLYALFLVVMVGVAALFAAAPTALEVARAAKAAHR